MTVKRRLKEALDRSLERLMGTGALVPVEIPDYTLEAPKHEQHGDLATNVAMLLASSQKRPPREIAQTIGEHLEDPEGLVARWEIAGPGFLNFFIQRDRWLEIVPQILREDNRFGRSESGRGKKVQVEFVSANPTGPLHVGHGRGAALGDVLANLLEATGHEVEREYYINDAGTQMETLGRSVWLRYREMQGIPVEYPDSCYQGAYIRDLARRMGEECPPDPEASHEEAVKRASEFAAGRILEGIRKDLEDFRVRFDRWFSEKELVAGGAIEAVLQELRRRGLAYEQDGALWFRASRYGDEKDRVLVRSSGEVTYFASDIAYHWNKVQRGFDAIIDVWGADHHGYVPRIRAAMKAMDEEGADRLTVILVQLVNLLRGGEPVSMSTRAGTFVTLREVMEEVGADAARFMFLTRRADSALDFDLEVAKAQSEDNPVFYVQYAHARICSVLRMASERGVVLRPLDTVRLDALKEEEELQILKRMNAYPEVVERCAGSLEAHRLTYYLIDLVTDFHRFYKKHRILGDDPETTQARLHFAAAVKTVIRNGLDLLGVSAPERM